MSAAEGFALLIVAGFIAFFLVLIARGHTSLIAGVGASTPEGVDDEALGRGFALRLSVVLVATLVLAALEFTDRMVPGAWLLYVLLVLAVTLWTVSYLRRFDV